MEGGIGRAGALIITFGAPHSRFPCGYLRNQLRLTVGAGLWVKLIKQLLRQPGVVIRIEMGEPIIEFFLRP